MSRHFLRQVDPDPIFLVRKIDLDHITDSVGSLLVVAVFRCFHEHEIIRYVHDAAVHFKDNLEGVLRLFQMRGSNTAVVPSGFEWTRGA